MKVLRIIRTIVLMLAIVLPFVCAAFVITEFVKHASIVSLIISGFLIALSIVFMIITAIVEEFIDKL